MMQGPAWYRPSVGLFTEAQQDLWSIFAISFAAMVFVVISMSNLPRGAYFDRETTFKLNVVVWVFICTGALLVFHYAHQVVKLITG